MTNTLQNRWGYYHDNITDEGMEYVAESIFGLQNLTHLELNLEK